MSLEEIAYRANLMRYDIIDMIGEAGSGHPGGSLSSADIVATLYLSGAMDFDPADPQSPSRDRFILSKGHAAPVLYAAFVLLGIIEPDEIYSLRKLHSRLQGHPDCRKLPGVEVSTGSLGQGLSIAAGLAAGLAIDAGNGKAPTVFVLLGDGETQEGQVWEAAMFANQRKLSNLVAIIDYNNLQIDGHCDDVVDVAPMAQRWEAFGWKVFEVDGHSVEQIRDALEQAKEYSEGPAMIIAKTVKGKGVSFMEDQAGWHGKAPDAEKRAAALAELEQLIAQSRSEMEAGNGR